MLEHSPAIGAYVLSIIAMLIMARNRRATGPINIIFMFLAVGEFLGVFVRFLLIMSGTDLVFGPTGDYFPDSRLIDRSLLYLALFNATFTAGALFVQWPTRVIARKMNYTRVETGEEKPSGSKWILRILLVLSGPGLLLTLKSIASGNTLIANSQLENSRVSVAGEGPSIMLIEMPFVNLLLWYSYRRGQVGRLWWLSLVGLLGTSLVTGNRTKMVTISLILLALVIQHKGYKVLYRQLPIFAFIGTIVFYIGYMISFVRGSLVRQGGTFLYWAKQALLSNPADIFNQIYRSSFNGYDGFLSVINRVPDEMGHKVGHFWFESLTILIPRIVWKSKWDLPITNIFTFEVWGWSKGGIFVTGPGVMYLDSGVMGIGLGGLALGMISMAGLMLLDRYLREHRWVYGFCVASMCYFLARFSFAGGSNDVVLVQRLLLESLVVGAIVRWMDKKQLLRAKSE
ncbi:hypothetical protein [Paenibacillus sp. MMS18-CY102]|uniref:hypothetical protein n=1 Tax=Paenibacillus sp. MMS18-CY102 TaxID=2682849 RepID=UPI001365B6EB|nr:hypothetical protein [Paenibacillus sp. MMS18-CY102]MWC27314.1 hypothetical protein [Paenibacillus sp. MMS18-CY102]